MFISRLVNGKNKGIFIEVFESTVIVYDSLDCLEKARKTYHLSDAYTDIQFLILLSILGKNTFVLKNYKGTDTYKKKLFPIPSAASVIASRWHRRCSETVTR